MEDVGLNCARIKGKSTPSCSGQCPRQRALAKELPNPWEFIRLTLLMKTGPSKVPEDAAVGRKLSFSWPEQSQEPKMLLSATYCSLLQTTLPVPTACSGGSSRRQVAQGVSQEALVLGASLAVACERLAGVFRS